MMKALLQASASFPLLLYASAVLEKPLLHANCPGCNICTVGLVFLPLKPSFWRVTRPAKMDKATQEYDFIEILAEGECGPARFLAGWTPAADAEGAQKASQLPPFSPTQRHPRSPPGLSAHSPSATRRLESGW